MTLSKEATVFANFVPQTPPPPAQVHLRVSPSGGGTVTGAGLSCGERASTCDVLVTSGSAVTLGKLALDEVGALYWVVTASGDLTGSVHRMQDRFDSVLARGENPNGPIAVDATHVYFTGNRAGGFIRRVPRKGGEVETVLECGSRCFPGALRVDSHFIYFRVFTAAPSGQVEAFNKADGSLRVISAGNDPGGLGDVNQSGADVDVNDSVVYWNWNGSKSPYGIFRANADGTGFAAVDSSEDIGWLALRVDDVAVYYLHSGAIIRRLK